MIHIIPSQKRYFTDFDWLKTYWLFSFSNYYDSENLNHGSLRVFNDDIVLPQTGFGTHPHEEMEIISLVLEGEMEHQDTMGNKAVIRQNDVQRMTAGTGLQHSEKNLSDKLVKFFQIWIEPDKASLAPSYAQKSFSPDQWHNRLSLLASSQQGDGWVKLNTDASLYRTHLYDNNTETYHTKKGRNLFLYVISGSGQINEHKVDSRDQARITQMQDITLTTNEEFDCVLIDIPEKH